jgi:hypothetical protein
VDEPRKLPNDPPKQSPNQKEVNQSSSRNQQENNTSSDEEEESRDIREDARERLTNVDASSNGNPQTELTSKKKQIEHLKGELSVVANQIAG